MNISYELVMITTHQDNSTIGDFLKSVYAANDQVRLLIVLVSQTSYDSKASGKPNIALHPLKVQRMGTSQARNVGLRYLQEANIQTEYILFPDDDSSFDASFFKAFQEIKASGKCYLGPIFNLGTKEHYLSSRGVQGSLVSASDHSLVGCPNQLLPYAKLRDQIYFNENLGPGTSYGSCEDLDLFMRLNRNGNQYVYHTDLYSYHPTKHGKYENLPLKRIIKRFKSYSQGYCYIIFKYRFYNKLPNYFLRTFAGMLVFLVRLNFKLAYAYFVQLVFRIGLCCRFAANKKLVAQV